VDLVTGVQTCALPISCLTRWPGRGTEQRTARHVSRWCGGAMRWPVGVDDATLASRMLVLNADDDAQTRFLLELYCRGEPYNAVFAESGRAALARFAQGDIDAVVTDVLMPDVTGEKVLSEVKKQSPEKPDFTIDEQPTIDGADT